MIKSFASKQTKAFAAGEFVREFNGFREQAAKRPAMLNAATSIGDLQALPSNRLESLSGNRKGQFSIRINSQWRICFCWPPGSVGPEDVEIIDYH